MKSRAMAYVIDLKSHITRSEEWQRVCENDLMHEYEAMKNEIQIMETFPFPSQKV